MTLLIHPSDSAETRLVTDASDFAMGAVLEQHVSDAWKPLAFFSRKFTAAQAKYSTYDRELTAIYEAIKHFRHFLEGRNFKVLTDHKPLSYAFQQRSDKASPRQVRQLTYIAQFTSVIEFLPGVDNTVADTLSRIEAFALPMEFDVVKLSELQGNDAELKHLLEAPNAHLKIKKFVWGHPQTELYCDITGESVRPYIPVPLRRKIFEFFHNPAHPSPKITDRIIRQRYIWQNMHRDITQWAKNCLDCQQSKVSRHVKQIPAQFTAPDSRFDHVHMDIVGPLPERNGYRYCLTLIDRFSRWPEAIPLRDISAATVAKTFFENWIARFGTPRVLTTDQGFQFESQLFSVLLSLSGCKRIRTTAYHPSANGIIERWHRTMKAAIMCHNAPNWVEVLPAVLLGLRTHVRSDTGVSPAEFTYGTTLRVPGEFFTQEDFTPDPQIFVEDFRQFMRQIKPVLTAHHLKKRPFYFKDLYSCSHVFIRTDAVKRPLERPYSGPFKIFERTSDRVFAIEIKGRIQHIAVERLKPAHFLSDDAMLNVLPGMLRTVGNSNDTVANSEQKLRTYPPKQNRVRFKLK